MSVVDCYCVKPFNGSKLQELAEKKGRRVVVVEDHYPEGGIGEMLRAALSDAEVKVKHLAVRKVPHSGTPRAVLQDQGIDAASIVETVVGWVSQK